MDSPLGLAVRSVSTNCQWAIASSVAAKANRKLPAEQRTDTRRLVEFLYGISPADLNAAGVWLHSFGPKYQPIVLVNPAYARAREAQEQPGCSCGAAAKSGAEEKSKRYFGSQDYNAGRHSLVASDHKLNCPMWTPPETGHLHSWRRGFED